MSYETDYEAVYKDYIAHPNWLDVVENVDYGKLAYLLAKILAPGTLRDEIDGLAEGILEEAAHFHAERVAERLEGERKDAESDQWLKDRRPG